MVWSWGADVDEASRPGFKVEGFQEGRFESVSLDVRVSKCLRFRTQGLGLEIVDLKHICWWEFVWRTRTDRRGLVLAGVFHHLVKADLRCWPE